LLDAEREHHKSELASTTRGLAIAKLEGRRGRTGHRARQGSRSAEPVEAREVGGMSALAGGAETFCSMTVLRLVTRCGHSGSEQHALEQNPGNIFCLADLGLVRLDCVGLARNRSAPCHLSLELHSRFC
jgi:hypothetical protein